MPTGPGLVHEDEATLPDDPAAQLSSDEWNRPHRVKAFLDITPSSAVPPPPPTGFREFYIDEGVSPNRRIYKGIIFPDGTERPIYEIFL